MSVTPEREWVRVTLVRRDGGASSSLAALDLAIRRRSVLDRRPLERHGQAGGVRVSPRAQCEHARVRTSQQPPGCVVSALRCPSHQILLSSGAPPTPPVSYKMCVDTFSAVVELY